MVETESGVNAAPELARLNETTALTIGPGDLANSLGVDFGSDTHRSVIDQVFEIGAEADCSVGLFVGTTEEIERYRDRAAFLIYRSDVSILVDHYERILEDNETEK
jgi:2-keto-3-deoxy-L-rhamnonate aldolase RhmA